MICEYCKKEFPEADLLSLDVLVCEDCYDEFYITCVDCGVHVLKDDIFLYGSTEPYCKKCFDNNFGECNECSDILPIDELETFDSNTYCESCMDNITVVCDRCGYRTHEQGSRYIDETKETYCQECTDEHTFTCDRCSGLSMVDNGYFDNRGTSICYDCYNDYYRTCCSCGNIVHEDDGIYDSYNDEWYCDDCHMNNGLLNSWDYKPCVHFLPSKSQSTLYMGIELEIDLGGKYNVGAQDSIYNALNDDREYVYFKEDGSLDDGFEIVTFPSTLEYHSNVDWKNVFKTITEYGYRSHDANTCGLHIHVNRTAFGDSTQEQEENITKLLFFYEKFWDEIVKFSRRKGDTISSWAKRYGLTQNPELLLQNAKTSDRYHAVNLNNKETVEFRIFRGTLRFQSFIATLQFTSELIRIIKICSIPDLIRMDWATFTSKIAGGYEELMRYLESRDLIKPQAKPHNYNSPFVKIASGHSFSVALRDDGSLVSWGRDMTREVPSDNHYVDVVAYNHSVIAITDEGRLVTLGSPYYNLITSTPYIDGFVQASIGSGYAVALHKTGKVHLWGDKLDGNSLQDFGTCIQISAGSSFCVGLSLDGCIVASGRNDFGIISEIPKGKFKKVVASGGNAVALREDGSVAIWGMMVHEYGLELPIDLRLKDVTINNSCVTGIDMHDKIIMYGIDSSWDYKTLRDYFYNTPKSTLKYLSVDLGTDHLTALRSDGIIETFSTSRYLNLTTPPYYDLGSIDKELNTTEPIVFHR